MEKDATLLPPHPGLPRDRRRGIHDTRAVDRYRLWQGLDPLQPGRRAGDVRLLVFGNLVGIATCLWLAAGYTLENFLAPFGLSTYFH
jgi:hypothetical protein